MKYLSGYERVIVVRDSILAFNLYLFSEMGLYHFSSTKNYRLSPAGEMYLFNKLSANSILTYNCMYYLIINKDRTIYVFNNIH